MPRATFNPEKTTRFELKSCPGGYVVIRRHMYGDNLTRKQKMMSMGMQRAEDGSQELDMSMNVADLAFFDFARCIVEHNLEDEGGGILDFRVAGNVAALDGPIGEEVGEYIEKVNSWDPKAESTLGD